MKIVLVSYSDSNYTENQKKLEKQAKKIGCFDEIFSYNREWLESTSFYSDNKDILDEIRGGGYWLWKPFVILEALKKLNENDLVFYMDSGDWILKSMRDYLLSEMNNKDILLTKGSYLHKKYTKRDCFVLMDCDIPEYYDSIQLEAGVCCFKNNHHSAFLLNEWIKWCQDKRILTDIKNTCKKPNYKGFIEHRHDQSILTNLQVKYNLYSTHDILEFISFNYAG